jgi:hypothetical protein
MPIDWLMEDAQRPRFAARDEARSARYASDNNALLGGSHDAPLVRRGLLEYKGQSL